MDGLFYLLAFVYAVGTWAIRILVVGGLITGLLAKGTSLRSLTKVLLSIAFFVGLLLAGISFLLGSNYSQAGLFDNILILLGLGLSIYFSNKKVAFVFTMVGLLLMLLYTGYFRAVFDESTWGYLSSFANLKELLPEQNIFAYIVYAFQSVTVLMFILGIISSISNRARWFFGLIVLPLVFVIANLRDNSLLDKHFESVTEIAYSREIEGVNSKFAAHTTQFDGLFELSVVDLQFSQIIKIPMGDEENVLRSLMSPDFKRIVYSVSAGMPGNQSFRIKMFNFETSESREIVNLGHYDNNFDVDWDAEQIAMGSETGYESKAVQVYGFDGKPIGSAEIEPTKVYFFGGGGLYLIQGQSPDFTILKKDLITGEKTKISKLGAGSQNIKLSYRIPLNNDKIVYISLDDDKYVLDLTNNKLTSSEFGAVYDRYTTLSPDNKSKFIVVGTEGPRYGYYVTKLGSQIFHQLPNNTSVDSFDSVLWVDDKHFVARSENYFYLASAEGTLAPISSTKIWQYTQADIQKLDRTGWSWTDQSYLPPSL